jgi:predicted esterase
MFSLFKSNAQTAGQIADTVRCVEDPKNIYALYLPGNYSAENTFPTILFFEPGARAKLPLGLYKNLADKYSLIIACSYGSSNHDRQRSIDAGYAMLADIKGKFKIDTSAIFLAGFSGGARLSSILAISDARFAGVIACGATFAETKINKSRKIPYAMLMGERDMNFLELIQSANYLAEIQNPYLSIAFRGEHEWPDTASFDQAIAWHLMQLDRLDENESNTLFQKNLVRVRQQLDSGNWISAYQHAMVLASYDRHRQAEKSDSIATAISININYVNEKKEQDKILKNEREWRDKFYQKYMPVINSFRPDTSFHEKDWIPFRYEFNKLRSSKERQKQISGERLHDFAWRLCAEKGWIFYQTKDYQHALLSTQIWTAYNPDNAYAWLMLARINATQGEKKQAIHHLKKAIDKGLDKSEVMNDEDFATIHDEPQFKKMIGL